MKRTYVAVGFEGVTRKTERTYTHAVLMTGTASGKTRDLAFCGTEELATKKLRQVEKVFSREISAGEVKAFIVPVKRK